MKAFPTLVLAVFASSPLLSSSASSNDYPQRAVYGCLDGNGRPSSSINVKAVSTAISTALDGWFPVGHTYTTVTFAGQNCALDSSDVLRTANGKNETPRLNIRIKWSGNYCLPTWIFLNEGDVWCILSKSDNECGNSCGVSVTSPSICRCPGNWCEDDSYLQWVCRTRGADPGGIFASRDKPGSSETYYVELGPVSEGFGLIGVNATCALALMAAMLLSL